MAANETSPATSMPEPPPRAFIDALQRWKSQLLDLSRRNRSIYFKASTTTTIEFATDPATIWNELVEQRRPVDVRRCAAQVAADVEKRIKGLAERVRTAREEQGVQILFITFGRVHWYDDRTDRWLDSPLVFVPVTLSADRSTVQMSDEDDFDVSPSLSELFRQEHRISIPSTAEAIGRDPDISDGEGDRSAVRVSPVDALLERVNRAIASKPEWSAEWGTSVLDVFSFRKVALVQELERSTQRLWEHPIIRALLGDSSLLGQVPPLPLMTPLDEKVPAGALRTVLPADSSQVTVVAAAASGGSLVIQGPPGTGKSQTIANLIGEFLAQRKTVLFVAEKEVAREVVVTRLQEDAGLGEAVLHLQRDSGGGRGGSAARQSVLDELLATFNRGPGRYDADEESPKRLSECQMQLNEAARRTHVPLGEGGWTNLYTLVGESAGRQGTGPAADIPSVFNLPRSWLQRVSDGIRDLTDLGDATISLRSGDLDRLVRLPSPGAETNELAAHLEALESGVPLLLETLRPYVVSPDGQQALRAGGAWRLATQIRAVGRHAVASRGLLRFVRRDWWGTRGAWSEHISAGRPITGFELETGTSACELAADIDERMAFLATARFVDERQIVSLDETARWASETRQLLPRVNELRELRASLSALDQLGARRHIESLLGTVRCNSLHDVALAGIWRRWADDAVAAAQLPTAAARNRMVQRLAQLESGMAEWARATALSAVATGRPSTNVPIAPDSELGKLLRWARASRRPPLRRVLSDSPQALLRLKPCLVMSPLAVAQYLGHRDGSKFRFDVCIIDEASMIPTADVALAISLSEQLVVTGDDKQMPPTSFFDRVVADQAADPDDATFESVLDEAATLLPQRSLQWHYRSRDESLIAFSNACFYRGELQTFPGPTTGGLHSGVRFEFVEGAVYGRGGSRANPAEADRVVDLLAQELREHPERDVGVTAMSTDQQAAINARIEVRASEDEGVREWIDKGGRAKNLETVQGDECDTMILSLGYGRDAAGRLVLNFGPLNRTGGERRLNVAVTRARWKTVLVASIRAADIPADASRSSGAVSLRDYLDYAERGPIALVSQVRVNAGADTESPFEAAVLRALKDAGLRCVSQVGVGTYRIDIGILHPERESEFVLGVECDGASYHAAASARDRDLIRQSVLENMGWRLHRVWSTAWLLDPARELQLVLEAYERSLVNEHISTQQASAHRTPSEFLPEDPVGEEMEDAVAPGFGTGRSADITIEDALDALVIALRNSGATPGSQAVQILKSAFGLGRATRNLQEIADRAIDVGIRRGAIIDDGGVLRTTN